MTINLIKAFFLANGLIIVFFGLLINCFEKYLPVLLSKLFRHGKFCSNIKHKYLDSLEVPKRWFKHFYTFAGPLSTAGLTLVYYKYYLNGKVPDVILWMFNVLLGQPIQLLVPKENTFLAMILFTIHCWKRFYESHYISVYSDVSMNFLLYFIGLMHYLGTTVCMLGESYGIRKDTNINLDWTRLTYLEYTCAVVLLVSTYMQYRTNVILSNLRKNKKGVVVTRNYKIPRGELFNWISGPLQFTEIVIYICLTIILRRASSFYFVTFWVISNQVECAYLSHEWSLRTFENYPDRKIILPLIF